MKSIYIIIKILLITFVIGGCYLKPKIDRSYSYIFLFKSNNIRLNDASYILFGKNFIQIDILNTTKQIASISIFKDSICLKSLCYSKDIFNKKYLSKYYLDNMFENIIRFNPIYNGLNLKIDDKLKTQKISNQYVDIIYKISKNMVYFKDFKNNIEIKLERL